MARALARLLLVAGLAWGGAAVAQAPGVQALGVLGNWRGNFTWDDEPDDPQPLTIEFVGESSGPNGTRRFTGTGVYRTDRETRVTMTLDLDLGTREIRLSEGAAPDNPDFVNDGVHVGTLSADASRIDARWVSKSDGRQGRLVLTRVGQGGK
jgi:hypothetical protein